MRKSPALFCLLTVFASALNAQTVLRPEEISIRQGLSQVFVPCLLQDREGFLWAGTKNGLNRFDGRTFSVFTRDPDDAATLSHNHIWALAEAADFLLVANNGGVLDFFHKKTRRVLHLPLGAVGADKMLFVQDIFLDAGQNIWILGGDESHRKLFALPLPPGFWEALPNKPDLLNTLKIREIDTAPILSALLSADGRTLWFDAADGFFSLQTESGQTTRYPAAPGCPSPPNSARSRLKMDLRGHVWLHFGQTLWCFDGQVFARFPVQFPPSASFPGFTPEGHLLIGPMERPLAISPEKIHAAGRVGADLAEWSVGLGGVVLCSLQDRSGNLWLGTNGHGIFKLRGGQRHIQHFFPGQSVYGPLFFEKNGAVGCLSAGGVLLWPEKAESPVARFAMKTGPAPIGRWRIATDESGLRWLVAIPQNGNPALVKIRPDGQTLPFPLPRTLHGQGNLAADPLGKAVWLAWPELLLRFDTEKNTWREFSFREILPLKIEICALRPMPDGTIWLGTQQGLLEAKPGAAADGNMVFKLHQNEPGNPNSLRHNSISSLLPDPDDPAAVLWIGTKGGGLSRLDTRTGRFSHFTAAKNGLPDDVIYGILWGEPSGSPDAKQGEPEGSPHRLWLSSNKGIIRFSPKTGAVRSFTEANGLQSDEFNTWAYAPGPGGALMFGGINGLNVFDPARLSDNPNLPGVFVTGLKINNLPVLPGDSTGILPQAIEFSKKINLAFGQRNLTLEFAALEFTTPAKNRFRWILEGAETDWHPETPERSATYLNLPPGRYTFKLMAANADGVWNPRPAELQITVSPPWWRSGPAWLVYVLAAVAAARAFFNFQTKRRLEQAENRMLRDLDAFKSQLYVNITHEFRTPLTVILGNLEIEKLEIEKLGQVENGPFSKFLGLLNAKNEVSERNAENLLRLINQMLDLAKLENKALRPDWQRGDVVAYLKYVMESFQSLANARNLVLRFRSPLQTFDMDFDPERLTQIVNNLISNALKHTPPGGSVFLSVNAPAADRLEIEVRDTGTGIAPGDLPRVFERFFQAKNQSGGGGGTGIGLALTRELVKLFGGEIRAESQTGGPGRGAVFTVSLPVTRKAAPMAGKSPGEFFHPILPETGAEALQNLPVAESANPGASDLSTFKKLTNLKIENHQTDEPPNPAEAAKPELLLVEDSADVVDFLRSLLEPAYRVRVAYNGRAGMETAFETVPDLVMSDLMMPEMDGLQLCARLKNDPRTSHIPFVLLTARASVEDRVAGISHAADAYLVKPVHRAELLATLAQLLENRRRLQAHFSQKLLETTEKVPGENPGVFQRPEIPVPEDAFLQKLRGVVEARLSDADLSVEDICRAVGMSHPVVHRKVTALTGHSLTLFVRSVRLAHARERLKNSPEKTVSEIAYEVGFNDPKFFSRVFSETFGVSPTAFRGGQMS